MNLVLSNEFQDISENELNLIDGGGVFDFLSDIYKTWNDMWYDFGGNLYYATH